MKHSSKIACVMFLALTIPCIGYQIAMAKNGRKGKGRRVALPDPPEGDCTSYGCTSSEEISGIKMRNKSYEK